MSTNPTTILKVDIEALNAEFADLGFQERIERLYEYFPVDQVLFTSSFGTNKFTTQGTQSFQRQKDIFYCRSRFHHQNIP